MNPLLHSIYIRLVAGSSIKFMRLLPLVSSRIPCLRYGEGTCLHRSSWWMDEWSRVRHYSDENSTENAVIEIILLINLV